LTLACTPELESFHSLALATTLHNSLSAFTAGSRLHALAEELALLSSRLPFAASYATTLNKSSRHSTLQQRIRPLPDKAFRRLAGRRRRSCPLMLVRSRVPKRCFLPADPMQRAEPSRKACLQQGLLLCWRAAQVPSRVCPDCRSRRLRLCQSYHV
jgi:hypothetical protein